MGYLVVILVNYTIYISIPPILLFNKWKVLNSKLLTYNSSYFIIQSNPSHSFPPNPINVAYLLINKCIPPTLLSNPTLPILPMSLGCKSTQLDLLSPLLLDSQTNGSADQSEAASPSFSISFTFIGCLYCESNHDKKGYRPSKTPQEKTNYLWVVLVQKLLPTFRATCMLSANCQLDMPF